MKKRLVYLLFLMTAGCLQELPPGQDITDPATADHTPNIIVAGSRAPGVAFDTVNTGTGANTGTGDPIRTAFDKLNEVVNVANDVELYNVTSPIQTQLDSKLNASQVGEQIGDTISKLKAEATIGLTVRDTTGGASGNDYVATPDFVESLIGSGGGGVITKQTIQFSVDDTGAPGAGDSIFVDTRLSGKALDVFKDGLKQSRRFTATNTRVGYRVNTDTITVNPVFAAGNDWIIDINDPVTQTFLSLSGEESDLLTGLSAYWKLDESSGTSLDDAMDVQNGTATTGDSIKVGKIGNARKIGYKGYLNIPYNTNISPKNTAFSVSMWFYLDSLPSATGRTCYLYQTNMGASPWSVNWANISSSTNKISFFARNTVPTQYGISSNTALQDSTWYHVLLVNPGDGQDMKIYLNGSDDTYAAVSFVGTVLEGLSTLNFGNAYGGANSSIAGKVDEIGIWSIGLSGANAVTLFNSNNGLSHPFIE